MLEKDPNQRPYASELLALDLFDQVPEEWTIDLAEAVHDESEKNYASTISRNSNKAYTNLGRPRSFAEDTGRQLHRGVSDNDHKVKVEAHNL